MLWAQEKYQCLAIVVRLRSVGKYLILNLLSLTAPFRYAQRTTLQCYSTWVGIKVEFCFLLTSSEHPLSDLTSCVLTLFSICYLPRWIPAIQTRVLSWQWEWLLHCLWCQSWSTQCHSLAMPVLGRGKVRLFSLQKLCKDKIKAPISFKQLFLSKGIACNPNL